MTSVLIISKEKDISSIFHESLGASFIIENQLNVDDALRESGESSYDLIFINIELLQKPENNNDYKDTLQPLLRSYPNCEIIVISPTERIRETVKILKAGASNYVTHPLNQDEVKLIVDDFLDSRQMLHELEYLRDQLWRKEDMAIIQTKNPFMKSVYEKIHSVALTKSTVLLTGETGTGKGVLSGFLHRHSDRRDRPFVSVHCGAIPDTLLESELFGHEKGAFTGALRKKLGKFQIAHTGTIFLDEIGTLTPAAQIKLLQVLQDGTFQRVGGEKTIKVDIRVIAATNADLEGMCEQGLFRKDLYYRLNVFPIKVPPLQKRTEDIPHLVNLFLTKLNRVNNKEITEVDPVVMDALMKYPWPGNIRELENVIERAYVLEQSKILTAAQFPDEIMSLVPPAAIIPVDSSLSISEVRRRAVEEAERTYLEELLSKKRGKVKDAANAASITSRQLHKLMSKYGLHKEDFKSLSF